MEITDSYILKNQRALIKIYSNLSRQVSELARLGFDEIAKNIVASMDEVDEVLFKVGVEVNPDDSDEKLIEAKDFFMEIYDTVGIIVNKEKRLYRSALRKYLKAKGWENYQIGNILRDEPYRPIARLLDAGYIKAHGMTYWTLV